MSLSASRCSVSQKRTVSSLLAGRVVKRQCGHVQPVQEAALRLLQQHQALDDLLTEVMKITGISNSPFFSSCDSTESQCFPSAVTASLLVSELRREAEHRGVPLTVLTVKLLVHRLKELTNTEDEEQNRELLSAAQRVQLCVLLESSCELLSQGALCPKLFWQELTRTQEFPKLEVVFHLHSYNIITLKYILESNGVRSWLVSELKALCSWTHSDAEAKQVQQHVLTSVVQILVGTGFDPSLECVSLNKRLSLLCVSLLDHMLFWILDTVEQDESDSSARTGAQLWMELFDASLCGTLVSAEALERYFTHCLMKTLTYKPRLTVSDAIALQKEWTFAKTCQLLTSLFCQLSVVFSVEQLLLHLQQVLSTHEVNWKHVLSFLSTVLVYNSSAQTSLTELLNSLLRAAFENYDLESIITAFLLARQGALEGPAIFPFYSDWFKKSFSGSTSHHAASKKTLVFLLKFLSDLVPFEPPHYLKVHILHPPFVSMKHRSLLMEYVSLAKTRLADLKESVEDIGLYEDTSAPSTAQAQCQEVQDVEKAVSLFQSTGRISATVMEASIFRRPYFLSRFLPALLAPRVLPVKADARMSLIEALKKADKIPAAQYSLYVEACHKQRQQDQSTMSADSHDSPVDVLKAQLHKFRELALTDNQGELSALVSRMSHTLSVFCPPQSNQTDVIHLHTDSPLPSESHVVSVILKSFCQCVVDTSRKDPLNQISWASRFVSTLTDNRQIFSSLLHRLWDLFRNQVSSLCSTHVLGLAVFMVHLHSSVSYSPLVSLKTVWPEPVCATKALISGLTCTTHTQMLFCVRFCVAAVCYGMCREDTSPDQYIPSSLYKKLLYLVPRLLPEARRSPDEGPMCDVPVSWKSAADINWSWTKTALSLWRNPVFRSLQHKPQYQLPFSEWLHNELKVCRGEDALSEPERQEYQQWACMQLFLPRPEQEGGCGGDMRTLCGRLISTILENGEENMGENQRGTESCLPDVLSRLQECIYEMSLAGRSVHSSHRVDLGPYLLDLLAQKVSSSVQSGFPSVGTELQLHCSLRSWNRVLLALPAELFIPVTHGGGRSTLDCSLLIKHINQQQRIVCRPAGLLPCHLTTHLLKGVFYASVRCGQPAQEVNKAWSQISLHCPLLLVSTAHWWGHMRVVLHSLWTRLCEQSFPDQLQLLSHCHAWAYRVLGEQVVTPPSAPPLQLAACLYRASQDIEETNNDYISVLRQGHQIPEVLVFLLSLCVNSYLSSLLHPQETCRHIADTCTALLVELVDSADWLSIFKPEHGVYQPVAMVTPDEFNRLKPLAFYNLLCQQSSELLLRALCCPGFVHTAVLCYISLLQLFLEGHTLSLSSGSSNSQVEPSQIVSQSKRLLLKCISQMSGTALSFSQRRQLLDICAELDPEVTAALRDDHNQGSLSPEMDFL